MGITKEWLWRELFLTNIKDVFEKRHHHIKSPLQIHGRAQVVKGSKTRNARRHNGFKGVFFMILCAPLSLPAGTLPKSMSDVAELENFVIQDCGSCHGLALKGGLGPPLRPENLDHLPEAAIAAIIREGIPGTAMPPWKPLLTPADIEWISHQLKTGKLVSP